MDQGAALSLEGTVPGEHAAEDRDIVLSVQLENGWALYYILKQEELLGDLITLQNQGVLLILLLSIILGAIIIINVFMATRSLLVLKERMDLIRQGELKVRMPHLRRDEIGMLAQSINEMLDRIQQLFQQVKEEHRLAEEARFAQLKSQIRPHFLLNSLNSVTWAAQLSGAENVGKIASSLSSILERVLYEKESFVPLSRELDTVRRYLTLEELRSGDSFDIDIDTSGTIGDPYCPAFSIQPLVENAIKHGVRLKEDSHLEIAVFFRTDENDLEIIVEDNGPGFVFNPRTGPPEREGHRQEGQVQEEKEREGQEKEGQAQEGPGGIGLNNIHQRVQTYFGPDYGIFVENRPRKGVGVRVRLKLPLLWEHP